MTSNHPAINFNWSTVFVHFLFTFSKYLPFWCLLTYNILYILYFGLISIFLAEWVNSVVVEACNPSRAERLTNEDLVRLENYIKEFSSKYVYTHHTSSKEPLTEKVRETMTRNVKSSAYENLLDAQNKDTIETKDEKFVDNDTQIFNFARDTLKNISTKKPAILDKSLGSYIESIGEISCGGIRGTCWLVSDMLVITNHHVYMSINTERNELQDPNLPITVTFDYFYPGQTEQVVTVEVDEERDPQLESPHLDYKFLRLKENESLRDRVRLGSVVRSRQLHEGLVIIVGHHPVGSEMHEETCAVVSSHSWREKLQERHAVCAGVHMTSAESQEVNARYQERLPYDTTLFSGASGSPVFDMNGNIVAMHTQGYKLKIQGRKCSLMEFGVQFNAICEDIRLRYNNVVEQLFPNYNEEAMDIDN